MDNLLLQYVERPKDARLNFDLAYHYERVKHYAGACSYFLRCAEWADPERDRSIMYEAMLHMAICFRELGNRQYSEEGWLFHAISIAPERREAYWLMSQLYERQKKWAESYTMATIGLSHSEGDKLITHIGYEGEYCLVFQKAVAAWWISKLSESRKLFMTMPDRYELSENYINYVQRNISSIGVGPRVFDYYDQGLKDRFRFPFPGIELIEKNYSQVFQDMFILAILNGKRNGYYLELGSADPVHISNTFLLEDKFGWNGISVDINEKEVERFKAVRKNDVVCRDATNINFERFLAGLGAPPVIDYLQVDCEPPEVTYKILTSIPFEAYRFAVITFEHDYYVDASRSYREKSRRYLKAMGYVMVVGDISCDDKSPFEDWWVRPDLVDRGQLKKMKCMDDHVHHATQYMISEIEPDEKKNFEWGEAYNNDPVFRNQISREIFGENVYEKYFKVETGDVVVDIGASAGPFAYMIRDRGAKEIYCIEPATQLFAVLQKNVPFAKCFNYGIANKNGEVEIPFMFCDNEAGTRMAHGRKFSSFISENNIDHIDFLKIDCEGGEYDVFDEENFDWILKNVRKIAGEWHLNTPEQKEKFRKFRDLYLAEFPHKKIDILDYEGKDIKWGLWTDNFITYWSYFNIYIDNR